MRRWRKIDPAALPLFVALLEPFKPVRARRVAGEPENEADHFVKCDCGAWVDKRELEQVLDHIGPHERAIGDH